MPKTWNDEQLRAAVAESRNTSKVLRALGLRPVGGNYETIRRRIAELGLDTSHWRRPQRHFATYDELAGAIRAADSVRSAVALLGWPYSGTAVRRFKELAAEYEIDAAHFLGRAWNRGKAHPERMVPIESYLVKGASGRITTADLKKRLIAEQLLPDRCYGCEQTSWMGQGIPLELDHINGEIATTIACRICGCSARTATR